MNGFGVYNTTSKNIGGDGDTIISANTLIKSGFYMSNKFSDVPYNDTNDVWWHIHVIAHKDLWTVQVAYQFSSNTCPVYIRTQTYGNWNSWRNFNPGTATTAQVLKGYTFSSAAGSNLTGTYDPGDQYNSGYNAGYSAGNSTGYNNGYNAGRSNIRVVSGQYYANSDENVYYANTWRSRKVVAFNPGGNPMIAFAYRTDHADSVIMTSTGLKLIIGTSFQTFTSNHDFNSSSVHLPTATNTAATWNWYCAIY